MLKVLPYTEMRNMSQYLTESIKYLFNNYTQAAKGPFANNSVGEYIRNTVPQNFIESKLIDKEKYKIKASVGQGIWAQVPWIGIFRAEITDSAQNGVYIVYLLSADGNSLFLTFNQGFTDIAKDKTAKETVDEMRMRASNCIHKLNKHSFRSDDNIRLGHNLTNRAEMYQKGTIFYKEYQKQNLPSEEILRRDLKDMLEIYEEYYEKIYKGNDDFVPKPTFISSKENVTMQKIFFGAPGTGKSYKVNSILAEQRKNSFASSDISKSNHYAEVLSDKNYIDCNIWMIDNLSILEKKLASFEADDKVSNPRHSALRAYIEFLKKYEDEHRENRTTFHPDYDYAQFVGAYKPKKESNSITYSFVPQVFAKAYAAAWKRYLEAKGDSRLRGNDCEENDIRVFLVIEEINRGNCAQIFGDIFQLLDRNSEGFSQYPIDADCDFAEWLENDDAGLKSVWGKYKEEIGEGKLKLPPNLNILATMNTSDQSLFPMDSAFKRRFDWEYVPIAFTDEDGNEKEAAAYQIEIDGTPYPWKDFVETVNGKILTLTESEDKQLGEFFIKPDSGKVISNKRFLGKVMFYLWNEVCKDEHKHESFFRVKIDGKEEYFTFQDLYKKQGLLKQFMDELLKKE